MLVFGMVWVGMDTYTMCAYEETFFCQSKLTSLKYITENGIKLSWIFFYCTEPCLFPNQ